MTLSSTTTTTTLWIVRAAIGFISIFTLVAEPDDNPETARELMAGFTR